MARFRKKLISKLIFVTGLTEECRHLFPKLANETYSPHGASLIADELTIDDSEAIRPRSSKIFDDLDEPLAIRPRREVAAVPENVTLLDLTAASLFGNVSKGQLKY